MIFEFLVYYTYNIILAMTKIYCSLLNVMLGFPIIKYVIQSNLLYWVMGNG